MIVINCGRTVSLTRLCIMNISKFIIYKFIHTYILYMYARRTSDLLYYV